MGDLTILSNSQTQHFKDIKIRFGSRDEGLALPPSQNSNASDFIVSELPQEFWGSVTRPAETKVATVQVWETWRVWVLWGDALLWELGFLLLHFLWVWVWVPFLGFPLLTPFLVWNWAGERLATSFQHQVLLTSDSPMHRSFHWVGQSFPLLERHWHLAPPPMVIAGSTLCIAQNLLRLLQFLKSLHSFGVLRMLVGVTLQSSNLKFCQDLLNRGELIASQQGVVVLAALRPVVQYRVHLQRMSQSSPTPPTLWAPGRQQSSLHFSRT